MALGDLAARFLKMQRPLVAGTVAPPDLDEPYKDGIITYLEVVPATKGVVRTYFPYGFTMKNDVAVAKIYFPKRSVTALRELRSTGGVVVAVSPARYTGEFYVFDGILLAVKSESLGVMDWHVSLGSYPPLVKRKEYLYRAPELLALVESVFSGRGLYVASERLLPLKVKKEEGLKHKLPIPITLLGLAAWRARRVASRKEG